MKKSITVITAGRPTGWETGRGAWAAFRFWKRQSIPFPDKSSAASNPQPKPGDAHLRSTQAVSGYHIQATDGIIGHVCDFMMDDKSWAIGQIVVKTGHRFTGNEVLIPVGKVNRISYDDSTVFVNLTKEAVEKSPANHLPPVRAEGNAPPSQSNKQKNKEFTII